MLPPATRTGDALIDTPVAYLLGLALTLCLLGSGEALTRAAHEFPPPRLPALKRTGLLTVAFIFTVAALGTFLVTLLIPATEQALWVGAPLVGVAKHLARSGLAPHPSGDRRRWCSGLHPRPGHPRHPG